MNDENIINTLLQEFLPLFYRYINPVIHKESNENFKLNENQIKLMMVLKIAGPQTPTTISKFLDQPKGSLTTIIDSLEDLNFVLRKKEPTDRRKVSIHLTEASLSFLYKKSECNINKLSTIFKDCSENDLMIILKGLKKFVYFLEKNGGDIHV